MRKFLRLSLVVPVAACGSSPTRVPCDAGCTASQLCVYPLLDGQPTETGDGVCANRCTPDGGASCPTATSCEESLEVVFCSSGDPCLTPGDQSVCL